MTVASLPSVSFSLLKRHIVLYAGCGSVIITTTLISTAELVLFHALVIGDGINWSKYTEIDAMQIHRQLNGLRVILVLMFLMAVGIALFLVFAGVRDLVMHRRRELAMLRLIGARKSHVRKLIVVETALFSFSVALPSAVIGHLVASPFYRGLQEIGVFGKQLQLTIGIYPIVIVGVVTIITALSGFAAWLASWNITNRPLLEGIESTRWPHSRRPKLLLIIRLVVLAACLAMIILLDPGREREAGQMALLVPLLVVLPLVMLASYVVPVVAIAVGKALRFVLPGLMLLVTQRARREADRFTGAIMPIVLAIGLLSGFYLGNASDESLRASEYNELLRANIIVATEKTSVVDAVWRTNSQVQMAAAARLGESRSVAEINDGNKIWSGTIYFSDFPQLASVFAFRVTQGSFNAVRGTDVASSRSGDQVGDLIEVAGPAGTLHFRVAAVFSSELYEGIFVPWDVSSQLGVMPQNTRVLYKTEATAIQIYDMLPDVVKNQVNVYDRETFINQQIETRRANTSRSNIALFGTIYIMSVVSLMQSAITSGINRHKEFSLYRSLGLTNRNIVSVVAAESVVLGIVSALLLAVAIAIMYWRFIGGSTVSAGAAAYFVPWGLVVIAFVASAAIMIFSFITGSIYSLKGATRKLFTQGDHA